MMHVLMTADTVGGVWSYAIELTRSLRHHNVHVSLATMGAALSEDQWQDASTLDNLDIYESTYKLEWMQDCWCDVERAGDWLQKLARRLQPDLVHLNNFAHAALPYRVPVLVVGHSCVSSWHAAVRGVEAGAEWSRYRSVVSQGLRAADLVVAPTQAMLDVLDDHYGPLPRRQAIWNGRESSNYRCEKKEPFVFSAGRLWDEAKNIGALANVAPKLAWPVRVAGLPNPDGSGTELENVEFLGRLSSSQMADVFARASIYALPARYEPFGLTALEAGLSGCALVLGDIPTLHEVWQDDAWFVAPDAPDQLHAALRHLIDDEPLRQRLAERARRRALKMSALRMGRLYHATYRELIHTRATALAVGESS